MIDLENNLAIDVMGFKEELVISEENDRYMRERPS